jgi:hypothetical protein
MFAVTKPVQETLTVVETKMELMRLYLNQTSAAVQETTHVLVVQLRTVVTKLRK